MRTFLQDFKGFYFWLNLLMLLMIPHTNRLNYFLIHCYLFFLLLISFFWKNEIFCENKFTIKKYVFSFYTFFNSFNFLLVAKNHHINSLLLFNFLKLDSFAFANRLYPSLRLKSLQQFLNLQLSNWFYHWCD